MAVVPEINKENYDQVEHDVVHHGNTLRDNGHGKESYSRYDRQVSAEAINTVGGVREVNGYPNEGRRQEDVKRLRDIDRLVNDEDIYGKREEERSQCSRSNGDNHVGHSLKGRGPWLFVIQEAADHGHHGAKIKKCVLPGYV